MSRGGARQVLIVEDEAMIAMLIEDMLLELGFEIVDTVGRLGDALRAAEWPLDLAILDVNLAGAPSYPVADVLLRRRLPFIFVTGYGASGVDAAYAGAPVLQKPFRRIDFTGALDRLLDQES